MKLLDTLIVIGIFVVFGFLFYRKLKEPLNGLFKLIKKLFSFIKGKTTGEEYYNEVIEYG